jgi:integrase/ribosomal protein L40E
MVNKLDEKSVKMSITEAERFSNWAKLKIKSITNPDKLDDDERKKIRISELSNEQRKILSNYELKKRVEDNCNPKSIAMYLIQLVTFIQFVNKPFGKITKSDIVKFLDFKSKEIKSIGNYKSTIKEFFKWFYGKQGKDYPDMVMWINTTKNNGNNKLPEELLTQEDILEMVKKANNPRDKAIIFVGYESACRASELLSIRLKHVTFDKYGAVLMVNGKTGQRRIRLVNSSSSLKDWMNHHPFKQDPESPLWMDLRKKYYGRALFRNSFYDIIKSSAKNAGINKKVYPHLLRHSRLTECARFMTDGELRVFAGWTKSSAMTATYVHLSGADTDKKILEHEGKITEEESNKEERKLKPKICFRCKEENPVTNSFCLKCQFPLDTKAIEDLETVKGVIGEVIASMLAKPELASQLPKIIEEWRKNNK